MGANRVFFPQQALDEWLEQGHIGLVGDELTIASNGRHVTLVGAVHFVAEVAGAEDHHGLVGKADSVILGDNAYQVVEGFLGEPLPKAPGADKRGKRSSRAAPAATGAFAKLLELL
jgi:hypothetical protein